MNGISVRLSSEDSLLFREYAKAHGMTLTELIRSSVLEKIEDDYDLQELREALKNPNPEYFSIDEVDKELGF